MKITYLAHSSILIEMKNCALLFDDITKEALPLRPGTRLYVFVSHHHADHFDCAIARHCWDYDVQYIFSSDVQSNLEAVYLNLEDDYQDAYLQVKTFPSTDEGVVFVVECEGSRIFFAGDFHLWDWGEEDTEEESQAMYQAYVSQCQKLSKMSMDLAFLVCDSRLKERIDKGLQLWLKHIPTRHLFPIHLWDDFEAQQAFEPYRNAVQLHVWKHRNDCVELNEDWTES